MNDELLAMVEREVLSWEGVEKDPGRTRVALYKFGSRQIGHILSTVWPTSPSRRLPTTP